MRYPLLILAISWIIGLFFCSYIILPKTLLVFIIFIAIIFLALSIFFYYQKSKKWFFLIIIPLFLLGVVRMGWYQIDYQTIFTEELVEQFGDKKVGIRGYIDSSPDINGDLVKFTIQPISYYSDNEYLVDSKERLLVYLYLQNENNLSVVNSWKSGMGVNLSGVFTEIITTNNPGQFNYIEYLERQAIYWKIVVEDVQDVKVSNESVFNKGVNNLRDKFTTTIDSQFNPSEAGFLKSILLGDTSDLSSDLQNNFSITGLSHLLAISGLHFSIIAFIILGILIKFKVTRENAAIIVSIILIGYMILIGARPSVIRATIMTILMLYGFVFKNNFSALQALGVALLITTLYNPMWIFNIGFQLSFIITFYLLWGYPEVYQRLPLKDGIFKNALTLVIITQLASFPLIYYYFHQYSLISWLANLIIVPLFSSIILPFGLFILVFGLFQIKIVEFFSELMSYILNNMFNIIEWSANLSFLHFYGNIRAPIVILIIYIVFSWLLVRKNVKDSFIPYYIKNNILLFERIVIVVLVIFITVPWLTDNDAEITFLDVGQGDSIYIQTIKGKNILIDSGGNFIYPKEEWQLRDNPFDVGEDIVLPFLRYNGVNKLDLAILTHEDIDHIGGYLSIVDKVKIELFLAEKDFPRTEQGKKLYNKLVEKNIRIISVDNIKGITIDNDTRIIFIPTGITYSNKENDYSFAIILNIYDTSILFSGDIEKLGELSILNSYSLKAVDILKVGHHGSDTSSSEQWLGILQPKEAIISVGKNNRYNLPSPEVLRRLDNIGSRIWRTDYDGAIILYVEPDDYYINKVVNNNHTY